MEKPKRLFRGLETNVLSLVNIYIYIVQMPPFFCASTMPPFLKTLIIQNLKLKRQNKTVGYDLHHFIYAHVKKNMTFQFYFGCHQKLVKNILMWIISRR